jgi:transposase
MEWQQQMDRQTAEEASRKQEKEAQDRLQHQQMQEELERQRKQEEPAMKRSEIYIQKKSIFNIHSIYFRT